VTLNTGLELYVVKRFIAGKGKAMRKSKGLMLVKIKAQQIKMYELRIRKLEKRLDEKDDRIDRLLRA
tara:strand:+ start:976 stop:1176 length:201 start_codon:yes stop_codon:yes gene_type:complete